MAGLLRKILPVGPSMSKEEDDDGYNNEYSFAAEYPGPPLDYDIPRALPVDVNQLPVATVLASTYLLNGVTLPVIQPIGKTTPSNKKLSKEPKLGSESAFCSDANEFLNSNGISCKQANKTDHLGALGFADVENPSPQVGSSSSARLGSRNCNECRLPSSDGIESSCRLQLHDGCDSSHRLSGSLEMSKLPHDEEEDITENFQDYMDPTNYDSRESDQSSHFISSEIFSYKEEDCMEEAPSHVRRPSAVTFCDPESNDVVQEGSDLSEAESSVPARQMAIRPGKKGTCYRCLKGSRFSDKEVCIVCGAKYCIHCVMRAMGPMPEGRKCITCIGQRIDETKRKTLGRCSRMLRKLLSESEVKQKMNSEKFCRVNQLSPRLVYVNRQCLSQDELYQLQNCANPPKKLEPGFYWYDKMSGYWGKDGQKPCQIISSRLNIGGQIQQDVSNGNTNIMINNREITRLELRMLKFAGVKCEGPTSLWLSDDGSYQEEGMNNVKGNIWQKPKAKLFCAVLSLPTPPQSIRTDGKANGVVPDNPQQKTLKKFLLVGNKNSGTSTIYKQAKFVYKVPFSEEEHQSLKFMIQTNLYRYIGILLEAREQFEEEILIEKRRYSINQCGTSDTAGQINDENIYSIGPSLKGFSDWLVNVMVSGNLESMFPAAACKYAPFVEDLWKDAAIQATYNRRNELGWLPRFATYFLERAVEIARTDYKPSELDILYAEGIASSKGLSSMEFSYPTSDQGGNVNIGYEHDPCYRYQLIRVHPNVLGGNCKWAERFEDVDVVLFCVSLTDYDEVFEDKNGVPTNKMMASKQLFESIATHRTFEDKKFLLILNKFDLLEEKIDESPLTRCEWFHDFNPLIGHKPSRGGSNSGSTNPSLAHRAFQYIAVRFKSLFNSLTDKKLYVHLVTGLEPDNVDEALKYAREILRWDEEELNWHNNELSSTSIEASSSS